MGMRNILEKRLNSHAARNPRRKRKVLSEVSFATDMDRRSLAMSNTWNNPRMSRVAQRTVLSADLASLVSPETSPLAVSVGGASVLAVSAGGASPSGVLGDNSSLLKSGTPLQPWDVRNLPLLTAPQVMKLALGGDDGSRSYPPPPPPPPREPPPGAG